MVYWNRKKSSYGTPSKYLDKMNKVLEAKRVQYYFKTYKKKQTSLSKIKIKKKLQKILKLIVEKYQELNRKVIRKITPWGRGNYKFFLEFYKFEHMKI